MSTGRNFVNMYDSMDFSQSTTIDEIWGNSKGKPIIIILVLCLAIIFLCIMSEENSKGGSAGAGNDTGQPTMRNLSLFPVTVSNSVPGANCTPPPIDSFPQDLFTQEERRNGFVSIHILVSIYIFYCLAIICDEYLVPSINCICEDFQIPNNIGGATVMAVATSFPELATSLIGTFLTKGDIGVATIVGSAYLNILMVCACCGIAAKTPLPVDLYPLTRDCAFYSATVVLLVFVMRNGQIFWHEALALVLAYLVYMLVMFNNASLKKVVDNTVARIRSILCSKSYAAEEDMDQNSNRRIVGLSSSRTTERTPLMEMSKDDDDIHISNILCRSRILVMEEEDKWSLINPPTCEKGVLSIIQWIVSWPPRFAFTFTIPDCRKTKWRKFYIMTLSVCVLWIGAASYLISWMMTIIGHTLAVPNSVMGLTFLAIGATMPEIVSSIVVARQGFGTMSISNSLGSNIFNILICLGLPWLIRASMMAADSDSNNYIKINSAGLEYSVASLLLALLLLYVILAANRFYLDRKVGLIALVLYFIFILFASLFELNVFFIVNLPICDHINN